MQNDTLQRLETLITQANDANKISDKDYDGILVHKDYSLETLERLQKNRNRFVAKFETTDVSSFFRYCDAYDDESTVFVSDKNLSAKVIFDIGTPDLPGHGKHNALLKLEPTLPYKAVGQANGDRFTQREFFNWMQDWKQYIRFIDEDDKPIEHHDAGVLILGMDIEATMKEEFDDGQFEVKNSTLSQVTARGKNGRKLPKGVYFDCKPYESLETYQFFFRIFVNKATNDTPRICLRCEAMEATQEEMRKEFALLLKSQFEDRVMTGDFSLN